MKNYDRKTVPDEDREKIRPHTVCPAKIAHQMCADYLVVMLRFLCSLCGSSCPKA